MSRVFFKKDFFQFKALPTEKEKLQQQTKRRESQAAAQTVTQAPDVPRVDAQTFFTLQPFADEPDLNTATSAPIASGSKGPRRHYGYRPTNTMVEPKPETVDVVLGESQNAPETNKNIETPNGKPKKVAKQRKKGKQSLQGTVQQATGSQKDQDQGKDKVVPKKQRMIKKQTNLVRLDLKRKYEQKFRGALAVNRRMFTKNGRMKDKYRKTAASSQLEIHGDGIYNTFVHSLSSALTITLSLDETNIQEKELVDCKSFGRTNEGLKELIRKVFNYEDFRFGQYEVVANLLEYKSTLFISETGSGKSLTYILGSILCSGMVIVISPLISLMLDQVQSLPKELAAICIHSHLSLQQKQRMIKMIRDNKVKLLYITPEALETDLAYKMRSFPPISFVCIDEAHCISQLSHNFRTSYLSIHQLIKCNFKFENGYCVLALTASANDETAKSIMKKLDIKEYIRSSTLQRSNLSLTVSKDSGQQKYPALLKYLKSPPIRKLRGVLIYCRTYAKVRQVCNYIKNSGMSCAMFFSTLSQKEKTTILSKFREGQIKIIASTIALGMGLDFANLDSVIHLCMPGSVENYVQEIGRAGRRGFMAHCHMFLDTEDYLSERGHILADKNDEQDLRGVFKAIQQHTFVKQHKLNGLKRSLQGSQFGEDQPNGQVVGKICSINPKDASEKLDIKEESIISILLKMEELSDGQLLKVLAPSYQVLEIGFYGNNQKKLRESNELYRTICENSRHHNGKLFVRLIDKCNSMGRIPSDLLGELQSMADQNWMRIEKKTNVLVWRFIGKMSFQQFTQRLGKTLVSQMKSVQDLQLLKLNTLYTMGYLNSYFNMTKLLEYEVGEKKHKYDIETLLEQYFSTNPRQFYNTLCEGQHYLPIYKLEFLQIQTVKTLAKRFLHHEGINQKESMEKYINGKVATNIVLGVSTPKYNIKKYGQEAYFGAFKNLEYNQVLPHVKEAMAEYMEELYDD